MSAETVFRYTCGISGEDVTDFQRSNVTREPAPEGMLSWFFFLDSRLEDNLRALCYGPNVAWSRYWVSGLRGDICSVLRAISGFALGQLLEPLLRRVLNCRQKFFCYSHARRSVSSLQFSEIWQTEFSCAAIHMLSDLAVSAPTI